MQPTASTAAARAVPGVLWSSRLLRRSGGGGRVAARRREREQRVRGGEARERGALDGAGARRVDEVSEEDDARGRDRGVLGREQRAAGEGVAPPVEVRAVDDPLVEVLARDPERLLLVVKGGNPYVPCHL